MSDRRRLDIQGLRALAVLLVVVTHAALPLTGGFIGVDVFFVISGFVITGLLVREWASSGRVSLAAFYIRRLRRLLPALALVVTVTCLASALLQSPNGEQQQTAQTALGALLLSANLAIPRLSLDYFARDAALNPLLHTWSLSVEEQFYLVFPALLIVGFVLARRRRSDAFVSLLVGVTTTASIGFLWLATYRAELVRPLSLLANPFYSSIGRAWEFGIGALLALNGSRLNRLPGPVLTLAGVIGLATIIGAAAVIGPGATFPGLIVVVPVVATALVLAAGEQHRTSGAGALLRTRPLVWIGDRSYSWYLWHWPAIVLGPLLFPHWPLALFAAAALIPAALSYRFVEQPLRQGSSTARLPWLKVAIVAGGGTLLAAGGLGFGAQRGWGQPWTLGAHIAKRRGCDAGLLDEQRCRWDTPQAKGTIALVGDSQAWAIADGVIPAAATLGYASIVWANNGCPFVLAADPANPSVPRSDCTRYNTELLARTLALKPALVVIANQSAAYATPGGQRWHDDLSRTVASIRAAGAGVMFVNVVPFADEQTLHRPLLFAARGDRFVPRAASTSVLNAHAVETRIATEHSGTGVFNPWTTLCDATRCRVADAEDEFYTDTNHLSRPGALRLEPALRETMAQVLEHVRVN